VLTNLDTRGNGISGEAAQQLAAAVLASAPLEVFGEVPLKELRADALTELDLSNKNLGPAEGIVLAGLLKVNAVLTSLDVGYNQLTEEATLGLVHVERQRNKLISLCLASCNISPTGAKEIADWASVSAVLTELNLYDNKIEAEGATAIAKALEVNRVLTKLNLFNNTIGPEGATAIAKALEVNAVLTDLNLEYNNLNTEARDALRAAKSASLKLVL